MRPSEGDVIQVPFSDCTHWHLHPLSLQLGVFSNTKRVFCSSALQAVAQSTMLENVPLSEIVTSFDSLQVISVAFKIQAITRMN